MAKEIKFNIKLTIDGKEQLVTAAASTNELRQAMVTARSAADTLREKLDFTQAVQRMQGIANAVSQLAGTLNSATAENRSFGAAMRAANTMAGKDAAGFAQLKEQVSALSATIPIARDELANGLYQVISNGVPEDNWISYLQASAKSAIGGIADVGEVVKVTSTVIKNYGLEWSAAQDIQDKIQLTAKNGVTSFEQLAQALPRVTSNAATLGVSIEELLATFSTLTGVSGNTAEVSTQLAAIFTALVKPSSEATKTAQEMGIQFDAAAIKAAGGMQNFLTSLDSTIKEYAQSSGRLEQEIYGKLFGSAESLRALIPLTGELRDKFTENVGAMADSTGTIDAAFKEMGSTGSSQLQMLKNKWGELTDGIADSISGIQPMLNFSSQIGMTAVSVFTLVEAFKKLHITQALMSKSLLRNIAAYALFGTNSRKVAQATNVMSQSFRSAATRAVALKVAIRGLMSATVVGIALTALSVVIEKLAESFDKAGDAAGDAADGMDAAGKAAERQKALEEAASGAYTDAQSSLRLYVERLRTLTEARKAGKDVTEEERKIVEQLNSTYGESMGYFSSVSKWYDALTRNSEAYCRQMVLEAKTRTLANQIAEKEAENHSLRYDEKGNARWYSNVRERKPVAVDQVDAGDGKIIPVYESQEIAGTSEVEQVKKKILDNKAVIADLERQMRSAAKEAANITLPVKGSASRPQSPSVMPPAPKKSAGGASSSKAEQPAAEGSMDWYQERLDELRRQVEAAGDEAAAKALQSEYAVLEGEYKDYKVRIGVEQPDKEEARTAMETLRDELSAAEREFDDAVTVEAKVEAAAKVAEIQARIDEATRGKVSISADVEPAYIEQGSREDKRASYGNAQSRAQRIQEDYEIGIIGRDEAEREIAALNEEIASLGDGMKPLRLEVETDTSGFSKALANIKSGWGSVQGIGGGVESITEALEGNANAWQTISGLMNGFISIAEGINGIVELFNTLTATTQAHTAATTTDTIATQTDTTVTQVNTVAKQGEAIGNATASGAKLPFPANIAAIAAGVAAVVAAFAMISGGFATGGVVGGGSTFGDRKFARVNSGEMILNKWQQARLFAMVNGLEKPRFSAPQRIEVERVPSSVPSLGALAGAAAEAQAGTVRFEVSGRNLVGTMANETRISGKSGRRTNIRI